MLAIISDIHGNLEALQAVLRQLRNADEILCAGDVVGYGPNPNECCELVQERGILCVQGNHDFVCANLDRLDSGDAGFSEEDRELCRRFYDQKNTAAQAASRWTSSVLTEETRQFLRSLPLELNVHGLTVVHGRPGTKADMLNEYMLPGSITPTSAAGIKGSLLVVGHSHMPIRMSGLLNPGSVGQPRDRDWRASYAVMQEAWYRFSYVREEDMSFRIINQLVDIYRISYDVNATVAKIKGLPGVPNSLGDRLTVGL